MIESLVNSGRIDLNSQINEVEISLGAIKNTYAKNIKNGQAFINYHIKEIYFRLEVIKALIDKKIKEVDSNGTI